MSLFPQAILQRLVRGLVLGVLLAAAAGVGATGCTAEECSEPNAAGECVQTCDPAACAPGHACVGNDCRPACTGQQDCPVGFNCVTVYVDGTDQTGDYCYQLDYAKGGRTGQEGSPCATSDECDALRGWTCLEGSCRRPCARHSDCGTGHCEPTPTGLFCVQDAGEHGPGQYGTSCPGGDAQCDAAAGFVCSSSAEADPDNYCTKTGCTADTDCPVGHYCADGSETTECRARDYCRPCETDVDCLGVAGAICARDTSGAKVCTFTCDIASRGACPWGSASICGVTDTELGVATCSHKSGSCVGTGGGCEPCREDSDCGTNGMCLTLIGTAERMCVDMGTDCATDADCPLSPGGAQMVCTIGEGIPTDYIFYAKCLPPNLVTSIYGGVKFGCWPL